MFDDLLICIQFWVRWYSGLCCDKRVFHFCPWHSLPIWSKSKEYRIHRCTFICLYWICMYNAFPLRRSRKICLKAFCDSYVSRIYVMVLQSLPVAVVVWRHFKVWVTSSSLLLCWNGCINQKSNFRRTFALYNFVRYV